MGIKPISRGTSPCTPPKNFSKLAARAYANCEVREAQKTQSQQPTKNYTLEDITSGVSQALSTAWTKISSWWYSK